MNTTALYSGLAIVVGTHAYMLYAGMPESQHTAHALINLGAAGLIYYGAMY
mgnify:CR=1 FL=1|tara:strand:+ start:89 stop:241 length:153 start_codon:yes stop_codon:yes gene_type:complete